MGELQDQVAIVTGAARGIGRGTALALAAAGARVTVNYLDDRAEAEGVAAEIRSGGGQAFVVQADVADQQAVERLVAETVSHFGRLDIAVGNAAFSERGLFHEVDMAGFRRTIDVTMWGPYYLLRAAATRMIAQGGGGSIVVIGSPHAYVPVPRSMAYNMAKGAIWQMAKTAAIELVEHRIRVNIITPGWIDTPGERKYVSDEGMRQAAEKLPWKRLGRPDEIGRAVVFLCDPKSDYMTGGALLVDGGITLPWWANRGSAVPE